MGVDAQMAFVFRNNKAAQNFSYWLYMEGHLNKTLSGRNVEVNLFSHGDHFVVMEEARERGGKITKDNIEDDY